MVKIKVAREENNRVIQRSWLLHEYVTAQRDKIWVSSEILSFTRDIQFWYSQNWNLNKENSSKLDWDIRCVTETFAFLCVCLFYLHICLCMPGAQEGSKRVFDSFELEFQTVVSNQPCTCWKLKQDLAKRTAIALKCWAISPTTVKAFKNLLKKSREKQLISKWK